MEIPHFGSMRGKERELIVLRSDNGDTWKEHQCDARPEDLSEMLAGMDEGRRKVILHGPAFAYDMQSRMFSPQYQGLSEREQL